GGKGGKTVLRAAMDNILPPEILRRKKVGFRVPIGEWFRGPYRDFLQDMLVSESSSLAQVISAPKLRRLVTEHLSGRQNHEKVLWSLTNLELFLRTFKVST
ncbi:asparagine synthase-related protein, partial [Bradyrhizobium sp. P5_C12]